MIANLKVLSVMMSKIKRRIRICLILATLLNSSPLLATTYVSLYGGPGSPVPLVDIVRFRDITIEPYYILTAAIGRTIWLRPETVALEGEAQLTKHFERASLYSMNAAVIVRWLRTPWSDVMNGSFAFGNGLSYATGEPVIESLHIKKTSRFLYHLLFEWAVPLEQGSRWQMFLRVHHRSGAFGLFDGVVGGSDFLCLGLRFKL